MTTIARLFAGAATMALGCLVVPAPAPAADDTVILLRSGDADRYDPHRSTALAAAEILYMIGDTLVTLDRDLKTIHPGLAERWTVSEDGLVYTFTLRDGVTFCDGRKLDAAGVAASIRRWIAPDFTGVSKWKAGKVADIATPDARTVVYTLSEPYSELLYQMTQFNFVIVDADQAKALGDDFGVKAINGTGPFCFESWEPRTQTVLKRHDGYTWGPPFQDNRGPARVAGITWKIAPEDTTRLASLRLGQAHASYAVPSWSLAELRADPAMTLVQPPVNFRTDYIGMKITRPHLADIRVRKAVSLAIDQKALAEGVFFGAAEPAMAYFSEKTLDFDATLDLTVFDHVPAAANALLDDAGWTRGTDGIRVKDGQRLELVFYSFSTPQFRQMAEAVQGDLKRVGIDARLEIFDSTIVWGKLKTQDYDLYIMNFPYLSAGDAMNLYFPAKNMPSPNRMNWNDPQTDALIDAGNRARNDAERAAAFAGAQQRIHDAVLWKPLVHESLFVAVHEKLAPFTPHGITGAAFYNGLDLTFR